MINTSIRLTKKSEQQLLLMNTSEKSTPSHHHRQSTMERTKKFSNKTTSLLVLLLATNPFWLAICSRPASAAKAHDQVYIHNLVEGNKREPPIFYTSYPAHQLAAASNTYNSFVRPLNSAKALAVNVDRIKQVTSTTKYRSDVANIRASSNALQHVNTFKYQQPVPAAKSTSSLKFVNFPSFQPASIHSGTYSKLGNSVTHGVSGHVGTSAINNSPSYNRGSVAAGTPTSYENVEKFRGQVNRQPFGSFSGSIKQQISLPSAGGSFYGNRIVPGYQPSKDLQFKGGYNQRNYDFGYVVNGGYNLHGDNHQFSHQESARGKRVQGVYTVKQPDGRTRIVEYFADETGFHPVVRYV